MTKRVSDKERVTYGGVNANNSELTSCGLNDVRLVVDGATDEKGRSRRNRVRLGLDHHRDVVQLKAEVRGRWAISDGELSRSA